jgi:DNA polymerase II small subunit/DNA polymerase delta subunit B
MKQLFLFLVSLLIFNSNQAQEENKAKQNKSLPCQTHAVANKYPQLHSFLNETILKITGQLQQKQFKKWHAELGLELRRYQAAQKHAHILMCDEQIIPILDKAESCALDCNAGSLCPGFNEKVKKLSQVLSAKPIIEKLTALDADFSQANKELEILDQENEESI